MTSQTTSVSAIAKLFALLSDKFARSAPYELSNELSLTLGGMTMVVTLVVAVERAGVGLSGAGINRIRKTVSSSIKTTTPIVFIPILPQSIRNGIARQLKTHRTVCSRPNAALGHKRTFRIAPLRSFSHNKMAAAFTTCYSLGRP